MEALLNKDVFTRVFHRLAIRLHLGYDAAFFFQNLYTGFCTS